ncbi:MAG TPA: TSCPD domain-containing protein, partial [Acetobacteraceae bacterium]|nr:TSCPD domain-containing protein [Acetobacteraceae bacterium]
MSRLATLWDGLALRRTRAAPDEDAAPRRIALPESWEEDAAAALAALASGAEPVLLPRLAERWIAPLAARGRKLRILADEAEAARFADDLRLLLLARRGAPGASLWLGEAKAPRFVLNLPAFLVPGAGTFEHEAYAEAVATAVTALDIATGAKAARLHVGFADLAGLLAGLGIAYDSAEGRATAAAI